MAHAGDLVRVRIGWYVLPTLEPEAMRAVRVGGRLGCISAARSFGLAVPVDHRLHVTLDPHATRLRSSSDPFHRVHAGEERGVVWHRSDQAPRTAHERFRVALPTCVREVLACFGTEWAVGVLDSALSKRLIRSEALEKDAALASTAAEADGRSESILESVLRVRLRAAGIHPDLQVEIGPYRVDFLIDGWLVVECDGAFHGTEEQFAWDRRRDAYLNATGYRVLRFTYRQVVDEWAATLHTIRSVHRQGRPEDVLT